MTDTERKARILIARTDAHKASRALRVAQAAHAPTKDLRARLVAAAVRLAAWEIRYG